MGSQGPQPTPARFDPTWRRMAGSALVLFLVILAFLVGRVRAGADPGLAGSRTATPAPAQTAPPSSGSGSGSGSAGSQPGGPADDNFGNAVPDDGGFDDGGGGTQGFDPPSTHVS